MDAKATIKQFFYDFKGKTLLTVEVEGDVREQLAHYDGALDLVLKKHREKRSLDANGYYWKLLSMLADALNVSKPELHNIMLRRYGQIMQFDGNNLYAFIPDTDEAEQRVLQEEFYHLKPTSNIRAGKGDVDYRAYVYLKGSSQLDTKEFSTLLDGLISEAKQVGIETATPKQIEEYKQRYGVKLDAKKHINK